MSAQRVIDVSQLSFSYPGKEVLKSVSLHVKQGEIVSVIGPSGSGKSTLLRLLCNEIVPDAGSISHLGDPLVQGQHPFAFMPQRDALMPWRTILGNTAIGLEIMGASRKEAQRESAKLFPAFGLAGTEQLYPRQLSGGMRQRAALLRTVVQQKSALLLDEPFGALDAITRDQLHQWILKIWQQQQLSMLLITHDVREAIRLSDRVYVLSEHPATTIGSLEVDRSIDRGASFSSDPRVADLEIQALKMLQSGMDRD